MERTWRLLLYLVVVVSAVVATSDVELQHGRCSWRDDLPPCWFTNTKGYFYDFCSISYPAGVSESFSFEKKDYKYYVNFAAPVVEARDYAECAGCSSCRVYMSGGMFFDPTCGGLTSNQWFEDLLASEPDEGFRVGYNHGHTYDKTTIVSMHCNREGAGVGMLTDVIDDPTDNSFSFQFESLYACPVRPPVEVDDCTFVASDGSFYDLIPLKQSGSDRDYFFNFGSDDFYINICHSTLYAGDYSHVCDGCGVCQVNELDYTAHCVGEVEDPPHFEELSPHPSGGLIYHYANGSLCGNGPKKYESVIYLLCLPGEEFLVTNVTEVEECVYEYVVFSKYACRANPTPPVECHFETSGGLYYDLTALSLLYASESDYEYDYAGHLYSANVCHDVLHPSSMCHTCAVCQTNQYDVSHCLGATSSIQFAEKPDPSSGVLVTYTGGDKCHNDSYRQVMFDFVCEPDFVVPQITAVEEVSHCHYEITFRSAHACPIGEGALPCTYTSSTGYRYDLSALRDFHTDFTFHETDLHYEYYVDFCRPTNVTSSKCAGNCSVCQEVVPTQGGAEDLGATHCGGTTRSMRISDDYVDPSGGVMVTYVHGDTCSSGEHRCSVINAVCDPAADPGYVVSMVEREERQCIYDFEFRSAHACGRAPHHSNCTYRSLGGFYYDLNPLQVFQGSDHTYAAEDMTYHINFCASTLVPRAECEDCGVCVTNKTASYCAGSALSKRWEDKNPNPDAGAVLWYDNGATCAAHPEQKMRSKIVAVCDRSAVEPFIVSVVPDLANCQLEITVNSMHACAVYAHTSCKYTDMNEWKFDLLPITRFVDSVPPVDYSYYLWGEALAIHYNPCGYVLGGDSNCGPCSVCLQDLATAEYTCVGTTDSEQFLSLFSTGMPQGLQATYSFDDQSSGEESQMLQTTVTFRCESDSWFHEITNASISPDRTQVWLEFKSMYACPSKAGKCEHTAKDGSKYDLSLLTITSGPDYEYTDEEGETQEDFFVNICHSTMKTTEACDECGVCQVDLIDPEYPSHCCGKTSTMLLLDHPDGPGLGVQVVYTQGDVCHTHGLPRQSRIIMTCDTHVGQGDIVSIDEGEAVELCTYSMNFSSIHACPYNGYSYISENHWYYDFSPLVRGVSTGSWRYDPPVSANGAASEDDYFLMNVVDPIPANVSGCEGCPFCHVQKGVGTCLGGAGSNKVFSDLDVPSEGARLLYKNGAPCPAGGVYSVHLSLECRDQPAANDSLVSVVPFAEDLCVYLAVLKSYEACPTNPSCVACVNGTCRRNSRCKCNPGWTGENCDTLPSSSGYHPSPSGGGKSNKKTIVAVTVSLAVGLAFIFAISVIAFTALALVLIKMVLHRVRRTTVKFNRFEDEPDELDDLEPDHEVEDYVPRDDDVMIEGRNDYTPELDDVAIEVRGETMLDLDELEM